MGTLFGHVKPTPTGQEKLERITKGFEWLFAECERTCGAGGRELALVKTTLQEACFWAKKAICNERGNVES